MYVYAGHKKLVECCRGYVFCPNKEAALGSIVVSLTCTTYQWGTLIALYKDTAATRHGKFCGRRTGPGLRLGAPTLNLPAPAREGLTGFYN